ncbi:hypothetical protein ACTHAM_002377 [Cellulomonas soli]|uniref:hypothetical protein n=1 Tax=Cellulomonas soli TaxID=931535 RepID=UPI003F844F08
MSAPLVFVDTETTGLHPGRKAWEIALIRVDEDGNGRGRSCFIGDVDLSGADPKGLQVGGFYDRHPLYNGLHRSPTGRERSWYSPEPWGGHADYRVLSEAQAAVWVEQWTRGAHLVGAMPWFDAEVLDSLLRRARRVPAWHYHLIDVEALALGSLAAFLAPLDRGPEALADAVPWSSDELSRAIGVEPPAGEHRHTAMGDARWAQQIYQRVMGGAA